VQENENDLQAVTESLPKYKWYHRIEIAEGVATRPIWDEMGQPHDDLWAGIEREQAKISLQGKDVLDVGCRDGLFSFAAERAGARRVLGIDNDVSRGATDLLIPYFRSSIEMRELNLYDLTPASHGSFDVVLCYGVLYHLRYPFLGLRKLVDVLHESGNLLIETAIVSDRRFSDEPVLYCPVDDSPYEWTSCSFFSVKGLEVTLDSIGMVLDRTVALRLPSELLTETASGSAPLVARQFFAFHKDSSVAKPSDYWEGKHDLNTRAMSVPPRQPGNRGRRPSTSLPPP